MREKLNFDISASMTANELAARDAMAYALEAIIKGSTHVDNNDLDPIYSQALWNGIEDLKEAAATIRSKIMNISGLPSSFDEEAIGFFAKTIASRKYSFGNCRELAMMALNYFIYHTTGIRAEFFSLSGKKSDHAFLVVGRKLESKISDPMTWGEDSYICDPWSKKVYPASKYKDELKNYCLINNSNELENFDANKHKIVIEIGLNTEDMREAIIEFRKSSHEKLYAALHNLNHDLLNIIQTLQINYGENDSKLVIIQRLNLELNKFLQDNAELTFDDFNSVINEERIIKMLDDLCSILNLTQMDKKTISTHGFFSTFPVVSSLIDWSFQLVGLFPETKLKMDNAFKKLQQSLKDFDAENKIILQNDNSPVCW